MKPTTVTFIFRTSDFALHTKIFELQHRRFERKVWQQRFIEKVSKGFNHLQIECKSIKHEKTRMYRHTKNTSKSNYVSPTYRKLSHVFLIEMHAIAGQTEQCSESWGRKRLVRQTPRKISPLYTKHVCIDIIKILPSLEKLRPLEESFHMFTRCYCSNQKVDWFRIARVSIEREREKREFCIRIHAYTKTSKIEILKIRPSTGKL